MKSNFEKLESRGFIADGREKAYSDTTLEQRIELLKSDLPVERTLGARLLAAVPDLTVLDYLLEALKTETKLYSKIEIGNSLVSFGKDAVIPLMHELGKIGNNQHRTIPVTDFKKKSYPLPRDIAGRTLIRIGAVALPDLIQGLKSKDRSLLSELIDVIGFICFYEPQPNLFGELKDCFYRNEQDELIKWKLFRAMSALPDSRLFLEGQKEDNARLKCEIERSLSLLEEPLAPKGG
jgi:hypothetical protein